MANYSWREVVTRRVEYWVPSGDVMGEFDKAYVAAANDYRRRYGLDESEGLHDDLARVVAGDDKVAIVFDVEESADE